MLSLLAIGLGASTCLGADDDPIVCATCHTADSMEFARSIHSATVRCQDCHGGADSFTLAPNSLARFRQAATEETPSARFDHGADYTGKPSRSQIPETCGVCHADVTRMNPYGLRTDQLARYRTSGHGRTLVEKGDDRVAVCTDCHGVHEVLSATEPASRTHPFNVPGTCGECHADAALMGEYDLPVAVVDEYRESVHGRLLFEQQDTGAPTCATCHGNHSAVPPGYSTVVAVCGQCHEHAALNFATSIHADQEEHKGCVQCHGGGEGRSFHLIERITKPTGLLIRRYAHLLASEPDPTPEQITAAIHPDPKQIIERTIETCTECHEDLEDDESLPKLFDLIDQIAHAERYYVRTAQRLDEMEKGVLLLDAQRFRFEDAKTHLIGLAPLQHTLDNEKVAAKVAELNAVCKEINDELDDQQAGLDMRYAAIVPIWVFSLVFAVVCYAKYKQLKAVYVKPLPKPVSGRNGS